MLKKNLMGLDGWVFKDIDISVGLTVSEWKNEPAESECLHVFVWEL